MATSDLITEGQAQALLDTLAADIDTLAGPSNNVAITGGDIRGLSAFRAGPNAGNAYLVEIGQTIPDVNADLTVGRITGRASRVDHGDGLFKGLTGFRIDMYDDTDVTDTNDPYLVALRARMSFRANRTQTGVEDGVGIMVTNKSFDDTGTTYHGTEAIYIGKGADPGNTKEWNTGLGIETVADNGIYMVRGPYNYGILMTAPMTVAALRFPNNVPIVSRNAADSANMLLMKVDTSDRLSIKSDTLVLDSLGNVLVNTTSPNLIGGGKGLQIRSTDGTTVEINASADTAASATSAIYAKGRQGSNDIVARMQANSAGEIRIGGESGGHAVALRQGGQSRMLMSSTALTLFDPYDIGLGTATGTKLGTAANQKLGLWGATPVPRPTGYVLGTGTAARGAFDPATVTLIQLAQQVFAMKSDFMTIGALGA
jgi:hypothetical protein